MAFNVQQINILHLLLMVLATLPLVKTTNIDCKGKPFHCVNSTHFMICVDIGHGLSSTVDDFLIPCPMHTECRSTNRFECEYPPPSSTTSALPTTTHVGFTTNAQQTEMVNLWESNNKQSDDYITTVNLHKRNYVTVGKSDFMEESVSTKPLDINIAYKSTVKDFLDNNGEESLKLTLNEVNKANGHQLSNTISDNNLEVTTTVEITTSSAFISDTTITQSLTKAIDQTETIIGLNFDSTQYDISPADFTTESNILFDGLTESSLNRDFDLVTAATSSPNNFISTVNNNATALIFTNENYIEERQTHIKNITTNHNTSNAMFAAETIDMDKVINNTVTAESLVSPDNIFVTDNSDSTTEFRTTIFDFTPPKSVTPADSTVGDVDSSTFLMNDFNSIFTTEPVNTVNLDVLSTSYTLSEMPERVTISFTGNQHLVKQSKKNIINDPQVNALVTESVPLHSDAPSSMPNYEASTLGGFYETTESSPVYHLTRDFSENQLVTTSSLTSYDDGSEQHVNHATNNNLEFIIKAKESENVDSTYLTNQDLIISKGLVSDSTSYFTETDDYNLKTTERSLISSSTDINHGRFDNEISVSKIPILDVASSRDYEDLNTPNDLILVKASVSEPIAGVLNQEFDIFNCNTSSLKTSENFTMVQPIQIAREIKDYSADITENQTEYPKITKENANNPSITTVINNYHHDPVMDITPMNLLSFNDIASTTLMYDVLKIEQPEEKKSIKTQKADNVFNAYTTGITPLSNKVQSNQDVAFNSEKIFVSTDVPGDKDIKKAQTKQKEYSEYDYIASRDTDDSITLTTTNNDLLIPELSTAIQLNAEIGTDESSTQYDSYNTLQNNNDIAMELEKSYDSATVPSDLDAQTVQYAFVTITVITGKNLIDRGDYLDDNGNHVYKTKLKDVDNTFIGEKNKFDNAYDSTITTSEPDAQTEKQAYTTDPVNINEIIIDYDNNLKYTGDNVQLKENTKTENENSQPNVDVHNISAAEESIIVQTTQNTINEYFKHTDKGSSTNNELMTSSTAITDINIDVSKSFQIPIQPNVEKSTTSTKYKLTPKGNQDMIYESLFISTTAATYEDVKIKQEAYISIPNTKGEGVLNHGADLVYNEAATYKTNDESQMTAYDISDKLLTTEYLFSTDKLLKTATNAYSEYNDMESSLNLNSMSTPSPKTINDKTIIDSKSLERTMAITIQPDAEKGFVTSSIKYLPNIKAQSNQDKLFEDNLVSTTMGNYGEIQVEQEKYVTESTDGSRIDYVSNLKSTKNNEFEVLAQTTTTSSIIDYAKYNDIVPSGKNNSITTTTTDSNTSNLYTQQGNNVQLGNVSTTSTVAGELVTDTKPEGNALVPIIMAKSITDYFDDLGRPRNDSFNEILPSDYIPSQNNDNKPNPSLSSFSTISPKLKSNIVIVKTEYLESNSLNNTKTNSSTNLTIQYFGKELSSTTLTQKPTTIKYENMNGTRDLDSVLFSVNNSILKENSNSTDSWRDFDTAHVRINTNTKVYNASNFIEFSKTATNTDGEYLTEQPLNESFFHTQYTLQINNNNAENESIKNKDIGDKYVVISVNNSNSETGTKENQDHVILDIHDNRQMLGKISIIHDIGDNNKSYDNISENITISTNPLSHASSNNSVQMKKEGINKSINKIQDQNLLGNIRDSTYNINASANILSQKWSTSDDNKQAQYVYSTEATTEPFYTHQQIKNPILVRSNTPHDLKLPNPNIGVNTNCLYRYRGRYADTENCRKFYICIGKPYPIVGMCPVNTVFSEFRKQCTKNLSHCVRNNVFLCTFEGRFTDIFNNNMYYICVKNNENKFVRYKLQCENGYHLNKDVIKCVPNKLNSQSMLDSVDNSETNSDTSVSTTNSNESRKMIIKTLDFVCEKEGKFPDPQHCRRYYVCSKHKTSFKRKLKSCDSDEVFDLDKEKCVDAESSDC